MIGDGIELDSALVFYGHLQKSIEQRSQSAMRFLWADREGTGQSRAMRISRAAIDF
jgi:hypothetical protein